MTAADGPAAMPSFSTSSSGRGSSPATADPSHGESPAEPGEGAEGTTDPSATITFEDLDPDVVLEPEAEPTASPLGADDTETRRLELQERLAAYLTRGRPRVVLTDNLYTMVSIKRGDGVITFRLHHMFLDANAAVLRALGRYAERQDRASATALRLYIESNDHRVREPRDPRSIPVDVEGKHHNLQEIFDRLNQHYFGGRIRARITWGPRSRRRRGRESIQLGSYTFEDQLIRIHPVLDAVDVPGFFVEWIVYHEMLHEIHDMPVVDGRRVYHTPEFRRAEAQFDRHAEAVLWERTHLVKLLER